MAVRVLPALCRFVLIAAVASAAPLAAQDADVPAALAPWRDWVLYGEEYRACPVRNGTMPGERGNHVCAWPGLLTVDASNAGADFAQAWTLYADDWVPLPGDVEHWPAGVTVGVAAQAVVERGGRPMLRLTRGTHRISGRIVWTTRPASLAIPPTVGLVSLRLDGDTVPNAEIDGGALWLGLRADAEVEEDRLDVVVHRQLRDSLPMTLTTVVTLDVAGQGRELRLEGAALAGFTGQALESELPAQLTPDGALRVQVRPGSWQLRLVARSPAPAGMLARPAAAAPWPADEIWSFASQPHLRVAALEGAEPVDAERSGVPPEWQQLPAYRVTDTQTVMIVERSRSDAAEANRLTLRRNLWLDFDGGGYTAQDTVTGRMANRWRLDMAAPYTMTMASVDEDNLLVTQGLEAGLQGVELRAAQLALTTTARIEPLRLLPATGYRETFDSAQTTLHVPPGYRLLAAPGADSASGAWLERWRLLDIFLVLIIAAAVWRLFGPLPSFVALVTLVVVYHEPWAPHWTWLNLLVAIALLRVLPAGRVRWVAERYRALSLALLVVLLIPFTVTQLRTALHPQLEAYLGRGVATYGYAGFEPVRQGPAAASVGVASRNDELLRQVDEAVVTGSRRSIGGEIARYQPGALVQTGPGLPDWSWTRHVLSFGGPVTAEQTVRLVLLGRAGVTVWRIASVALASVLLFALAGGALRWPPRLPHVTAGLAPLFLAAAALWVAAPSGVHAQPGNGFPSPALLDDLKRRLTTPAPCHPSCADISAATVTLAGGTLAVRLDVALQAEAAVPIPTVPRGWRPSTITLDGAAAGFVFRDTAEIAWVRVAQGTHRIELQGPLPAVDNLSLPFPLPPRRVAVTAAGWDVAGVVDGRLPAGSLELTRQRDAAAEGSLGGSVFPPYVSAVRRIEFDTDWQVRTTLTRVAPEQGAFTLPLALLASEAVLTPGIEVAGGQATVAFAGGEDEVTWESRLPTAATLTLTAPAATAPWSESWQFAVGYIWHAEYTGLPSTVGAFDDPSFHVAEYFPRPGETLTVTLTRPEAATGDTIAIDNVDYSRDAGARAARSTLELEYRSTRGDEHLITLPEGAELERVAIDDETVPLELDGRTLGLPVTPGEHSAEIVWSEPVGVGLRTELPGVDLGGGATNLTLTLDLPQDRWTLFAFGPTLGPAVLYWPELLALILGALALGRLPLKPLRTHEWLLLGFGLSTFAWPVLLIFALWALALAWRESRGAGWSNNMFNVLQIGLAILTVIALVALVGAIPVGLLGRPDMQIASPVTGSLAWFADRTTAATPSAGAISVSLWFYRAAMLAWALWLSLALLRWLPWAWRAYSHEGLWRSPPPPPPRPPKN
jgi:hypothetical protein